MQRNATRQTSKSEVEGKMESTNGNKENHPLPGQPLTTALNVNTRETNPVCWDMFAYTVKSLMFSYE